MTRKSGLCAPSLTVKQRNNKQTRGITFYTYSNKARGSSYAGRCWMQLGNSNHYDIRLKN
ncbi:hypothetical protein E2C01_024304 [Portunus trituberculatus]|uniref:Uncharacterized protein n=1 Tax=Portunus trituberculatus TaxID=210409 RepID=A0A5B7ECH0_PORTR|nr:hypothetical protein [Portunus trituberculatus]